MAALTVLAPVAGVVHALADVDDPVFSGEIVGPGLAVQPDPDAGRAVVAPVAGTVAKLHPHAFVLLAEGGRGVLVHLGINTVQLGGEGFTLHVAEGDAVEQGQLLVEWDPAVVEGGGRSAICPVIGLEAQPDSLTRLAEPGTRVAAGDPLLALD
ncbi:PTS sugar transporter subunit IIA [Cellulomonas hominis]|jgi:glucose-specific phosphotransferase system IIA component|uniref:PTS sugar transporter subunit IIA n=1 Tax=Cellulomonas hominis TaxID=156981 RepID=UPI001B91BFF3|nr:PTS glucose transporter subunit IIA [Cellulomonas hominis]VTR77296.1 PTS system glucose-specific EIIA component [Cellulomonas hominis]